MERRVTRRRSSLQKQPASTTINDLPDIILCHIISLLPIKDAIRTGAVMKRWSSFWNTKTSWELDSSIFQRMGNRRVKFEEFVDYIIYFHKGPGIQELKLSDKYYKRKSQRATRWIDYLVSNGICRLDVNICPPISPPLSLFTSQNLEELRLCMYQEFIRLPPTVSLSKLRDLYLEQVRFRDSNSFQNLINGCPKLMNLYLKECIGPKDKIKELHISHSTLKRFVFDNHYFLNQTKLHISTPKLATFEFRGNGLAHRDHIFSDMSEVNEAVIDLKCFTVDYMDWREEGTPGDRGYRIVQLLEALCNASILSISESCIEYLSVIANNSGPLSTACKKLESMHLKMWPNRAHANIVAHLMERCPKLINLSITVIEVYIRGAHNEDRGDYPEITNFLSRDTLHFHLNRVEIKNFGGSVDEHNLVKFILMNALVLEQVDVTVSRKMDLSTLAKFSDEIQSYPRASTAKIKIS